MNKIADKKPIRHLDTITKDYALANYQDQVYTLIAQLTPSRKWEPEQEEIGFIGFALDSTRSKFMFTYRWLANMQQYRQFFYFEIADKNILGKTYIQQGNHRPWQLLNKDENKNQGSK